ncbi:uncharacterized protein BDV14DRAFT_176638 [Aspergillus stella-maris]|uniref:uncharacterized protein n=1 Tax=Aspergillus stella-maris TaxID=1810926 RepID=UPI003CCDC096
MTSMVGASRGCQACADAQLRCNNRSPCSRCHALNITCTPPHRVFKFRDEAPALRLRYQSSASSTSSSKSPSPSTSPDQSLQKLDLPSRFSPRISPRAQYKPVPLPMDDHLNPSLTVKVVNSQQTQIFTNYILASFPCFFRSTETRVPVNWVQYVDKRNGATNSCFDWAIRASTAAYLGFLHDDPRYLQASQSCYHRALRGLANLLTAEGTAKSDEALATAITLAVFEKHNCSSPDAWLRHAAGIRTLMKIRGPKAHLQGFGRAMYIVYRNFLVTAALLEGEACFLEEPEWRELNEEIAAENAKLPTSSMYTDVVERGFLEVIKVPGLVKRTRQLKFKPAKERAKAQMNLLHDVQAARAALRGIYTEFGVSLSMLRSGQDEHDAFVGPVPHFFIEGYSSLFARGLRLALLTMNYLILMMDPKQRPTIDSDNFMLVNDMARNNGKQSPHQHPSFKISTNNKTPLTPPKSPGRPNIVVQSLITEETREPPTTDWMDRIISTMGLEAVHISLIG